MLHRGTATFTLDTGTCPRWLFERMVKLGREITQVLVAEYGPDEFIKRIADPVWFQSLGTVLAFDWNASGLTTILTAALKEAIRGQERKLGIYICGGKGKTSRKTPDEILAWGDSLSLPDAYTNNLVYNSRMSAKVDSSLIQDGFQLYHHSFLFSENGSWTVVQQGMNQAKGTARRYHWFSENIRDLIVEPHSGIATQILDKNAHPLNMTAREGDVNRKTSVEIVQNGYTRLVKDLKLLDKHSSELSRMVRVENNGESYTELHLARGEFYTHPVVAEHFSTSTYLKKIFQKLDLTQPRDYESLVATKGVGPKTIRALSLVGEVIYGAKASYRDPARYSFAHGGKDATPYPVDTQTYDTTIRVMESLTRAVQNTNLDHSDKRKALARLQKYFAQD